jgi:hypothetical protein
MSKLAQVWSAKDFDAISIRAARCQVEINGTDSDQISLEGDFEGRTGRELLGVEGRWLRLNRFAHGSSQNLFLKLPRDKSWGLDIFAGKGDVKAKDFRARAHIMLGDGHFQAEEYRGILSLSSGKADIQIKRFVQVEMPQLPPQTWPVHREAAGWSRWDWRYWEDTDWEDWGLELGERIAGWAMDLGRFFERTAIDPKLAGLSVTIGQGDVQCEGIDASASLVRTSKGDIRLKGGRIGGLEVVTSKGDIECASIIPVGSWGLRTMHGDIRLSLPANASARLDAATRNGDILSEIPVVRVTRQGPETYHGRRMVGMVGPQAESKVPELHLSAMHGDIEIKSQPAVFPSPDMMAAAPAGRAYRTQLEVLQALSKKRISVSEAERLLRDLKA